MMKKMFLILVGLVFMFLAGCGTTKAVKLQPVVGASKMDIAKLDALIIKISSFEGVEMSDEEAQEMRELIAQAIEKRHHGRFRVLMDNQNPQNNTSTLEVKFIKFPRTSVATVLVGTSPIKAKVLFMNSAGEYLLEGELSKDGAGLLFGGTEPPSWNPLENFKRMAPISWIKKRFAEGVAAGLDPLIKG